MFRAKHRVPPGAGATYGNPEPGIPGQEQDWPGGVRFLATQVSTRILTKVSFSPNKKYQIFNKIYLISS